MSKNTAVKTTGGDRTYSSQTDIWLAQPMTTTTPHRRQDGRFQVNVCSATCDATFAMIRATTEEGAQAIAQKFANGWNASK